MWRKVSTLSAMGGLWCSWERRASITTSRRAQCLPRYAFCGYQCITETWSSATTHLWDQVQNKPQLKGKLIHFHFHSVFTNALTRLRDSGLEENLRQRWINGYIAGIGEDMAGENGSLKGGQLILGFVLMLVSYTISLGVLCTEKYWKCSLRTYAHV